MKTTLRSMVKAGALALVLVVGVVDTPEAAAQPERPAPTTAVALPDAAPSWLVASPAAHGFDRPALDSLVATARTLSPLNSLLIARGDTTVVEWYGPGMRASRAINIKSASKTVLSALVGIALEEGVLDSTGQAIGSFFPDILDDTTAADSVKRRITLGDLLTMRAGLESTSFGNYGAWVSADSWVRNALERPLVRPPGDGMIYSTGTSHLVAVILAKALGRPLRGYAQEKLFGPLGVQIGSWQRDPEGYHFGGNNLALTPRTLLRFGQLYLRGGFVRSADSARTQVISPGWIGASWNLRVLDSYRGFRYGYFWWMEEFAGHRTYFAWGYGGQMLFVTPGLDLVCVMTSALTGNTRGQSSRLFRFYGTVAEAGERERSPRRPSTR